MLYIDPMERIAPNCPNLPRAVDLPDLEARTGADMLVSPLDLPAHTDELLALHLREGAMLVQRKSGSDLTASIGERLGTSLAKMTEWVARPSQKLLLFIGLLTCDREGMALIDGRSVSYGNRPITYRMADSTFVDWCLRGGSVHYLPRVNVLGEWLDWTESKLKKVRANPVEWVLPRPRLEMCDETDPLKEPRLIKDGRLLLSALPGMGPQLINRVWAFCHGSIAEALFFLTSEDAPKQAGRPEGIGPGRVKAIREALGLETGQALGRVYTRYPAEMGATREGESDGQDE